MATGSGVLNPVLLLTQTHQRPVWEEAWSPPLSFQKQGNLSISPSGTASPPTHASHWPKLSPKFTLKSSVCKGNGTTTVLLLSCRWILSPKHRDLNNSTDVAIGGLGREPPNAVRCQERGDRRDRCPCRPCGQQSTPARVLPSVCLLS